MSFADHATSSAPPAGDLGTAAAHAEDSPDSAGTEALQPLADFPNEAGLAAILAGDQHAGGGMSDILDAHGYEGHVALALDAGVLTSMDSTLDLLTSSHDLFDVPVLDICRGGDDA
jgi:hypothetical protein